MVYQYVSRWKKLNRAVLEQDGLRVYTQTNKGGGQERYYPYKDVQKVHLTISDVHCYGLSIHFSDGFKLYMQSLSFGGVKDGKISRFAAENRSDVYREWVLTFHVILLSRGRPDLRFVRGNNLFLVFLTAILVLGGLIGQAAWSAGLKGASIAMFSLLSGLAIFALRIGWKKKYDPNEVPSRYLPGLMPV